MEDDDPVVIVIVIAIIVLFLFLLIRVLGYFFFERKEGRAGSDVEHLDPSIEIRDGGIRSACFSWCSETGKESDVGGIEGTQDSVSQELQVSPGKRFEREVNDEGFTKLVDLVAHENGVENAIKYLEALQGEMESKSEVGKIIRMAQYILLHQDRKPTEGNLHTKLIIGVDARPKMAGGYLVNLQEMSLDYYVIKMEDFPWAMEAPNNSSEFEMKNLMFALATWNKAIRKYKKFRLYTDNQSIENPNNEFGSDADELVTHFTDCLDAVMVNQNAYINRRENLSAFAKYIQAADDFSRWEVDKGIDFLCGFYGISRDKVQGTVIITRSATKDSRAWYDPSPAYRQYIQRAQSFGRNFHCENCHIELFFEERFSSVSPTAKKALRTVRKENSNASRRTNRKLRRLQQQPKTPLRNNHDNRGGVGWPGRF